MIEDWLCSRVKLCQLITGPNIQDPVEAMIATESFPQPDYNPSSILLTLEAFTGAFSELQGRSSVVNMNHIDHNALGPKPVQTDAVHHFAEMLAEGILDAAVRKQDTHCTNDGRIYNVTQGAVSKWTMSDQEMLAQRLAPKICSSALEELARIGCLAGRKSEERPDIHSEVHAEAASYHCPIMHHCDQEVPATERDYIYERRYPNDSTTLDSLAHVGSLDYPDAPPSTPLLPEMMNSRASFTRRLKGGLAKEFLPLTPPPTPKDEQSLMEDRMTDSTADKSEFVVRLMRSLSLARLQLGEDHGDEKETRFQSGISDYAAQLSAKIIHCLTAAQADSNNSPGDVQVLANHLAEEVIRITIAEVIRCKWETSTSEEGSSYLENTNQYLSHIIQSDPTPNISPVESLKAKAGRLITNTLVQAFSELGCGYLENTTQALIKDISSQESPTYSENTTQALIDTFPPDPIPNIPPVEALTAMAGRLMTNTLIQAFSELRSGLLRHAPSKNLPNPAAAPVPWEQWNDQYLKTSSNNSHPPKNNKCSNLKSKSNYIPFDPRPGTVEDVFAENIVHEVLSCSIREASHCHLRCEKMSVHSNRLSSSTSSQHTQELQWVLLWAAASQTGSSMLQIYSTNKHIQQQLCSVFLQAQAHGWTVGHLMTSLLQYCEELHIASRGHSKIYTSLLGHLLLTQS